MVLVPVAVLVALSLTVPASGTASVRSALIAVGVALVALAAVRPLVPDEAIWPNSEVMRRCRWLARHLESKPDWGSSPVVMLTGSSATMFGLDPERIERCLTEAGRPATILPFALSGATLHERRYMMQSFLEMLGEETRRKLRLGKVVLFAEVFDAYDENPLYRMEKEAFSERLIQFLNPENACKAWQAYALQCQGDPSLPRWSSALLLARHSLLNTFAVGAFSGMEWPGARRRTIKPFFPLEGRKDKFDYRETIAALHRAGEPPLTQTSSLPIPQASCSLNHMLECLPGYNYRQGFYALPMLEPARTDYARRLRQAVGQSAPFIGPASRAEMGPMLAEKFWFDGVHPTGAGAELFSDWFAGQLLPVLSDNAEKQIQETAK